MHTLNIFMECALTFDAGPGVYEYNYWYELVGGGVGRTQPSVVTLSEAAEY